jgi:protein-S-isoprenylcysteine O-methyltransferase Ste14
VVAWINFVVLALSSLLILYFYVQSVRPAALEKKIGPIAYQKCTTYRKIASFFMFVVTANYFVYRFYPLPVPVPDSFPWSWWISGLIALVIAIPSGYLMWRGMKDAGEETMTPKKEHTLYKGIYEKIRHPQAIGEMPLWWVIAFLLHSPFLVLFSFLYVPVWIIMCLAEEKDLTIRYGVSYEEYRRSTGFLIPRNPKRKS